MGVTEFAADLAQGFVKFCAKHRVEAGGGLVEQQQLRLADQRARDAAALALAAGNLVRTPSGCVFQAEFLQHVVDAPVPLQARPPFRGEGQILTQRHVRKQGVVLKHITAIAFLRRQMDSRGGVVKDVVFEQDAAFVGLHESGDGIEHQRFAGAAGAEEHRDAGGGGEFEIQREARGIGSRSERFAEPCLQHAISNPVGAQAIRQRQQDQRHH